ncbi:MAG: hypothetical protein R3B81_04290 [bacterium]
MDSKRSVWLAALAAAGLLLIPHPAAHADRLPTRLAGENNLESDPWRPDRNDPGRALYSSDPTSGIVDPAAAADVRAEREWRQAFLRFVLRMIAFRFGGMI